MPLCIAQLDRACAKPRHARRCLVRMLMQLRRVFGGGAVQLLNRVFVNVLRLLARGMDVRVRMFVRMGVLVGVTVDRSILVPVLVDVAVRVDVGVSVLVLDSRRHGITLLSNDLTSLS